MALSHVFERAGRISGVAKLRRSNGWRARQDSYLLALRPQGEPGQELEPCDPGLEGSPSNLAALTPPPFGYLDDDYGSRGRSASVRSPQVIRSAGRWRTPSPRQSAGCAAGGAAGCIAATDAH